MLVYLILDPSGLAELIFDTKICFLHPVFVYAVGIKSHVTM